MFKISTLKDVIYKLLQIFLYRLLLFFRWKRKTVYINQKIVFPEKSDSEIFAFYKILLKELSKTAVIFLSGNRNFQKLPDQFENYPYIHQGKRFILSESSKNTLKKMRNGGIMMTAHFGNYEAIGPWLCQLKIPLKASYAKIHPDFLNKILENKLRTANGFSYSVFIKNPREILKFLKNNDLFTLVADQDFRLKNAVIAPFFKQNVSCNPLISFIIKNRKYINPKIQTLPIYICQITETNKTIELQAIEIPENIAANPTLIYTFYNQTLENWILNQPEKWFGWTHRRFLSTQKIKN